MRFATYAFLLIGMPHVSAIQMPSSNPRQEVLAAVKKDGMALEHASAECKDETFSSLQPESTFVQMDQLAPPEPEWSKFVEFMKFTEVIEKPDAGSTTIHYEYKLELAPEFSMFLQRVPRNDDYQCLICFEQFKPGQVIRSWHGFDHSGANGTSGNAHMFHSDCAREWHTRFYTVEDYMNNDFTDLNDNEYFSPCPICRYRGWPIEIAEVILLAGKKYTWCQPTKSFSSQVSGHLRVSEMKNHWNLRGLPFDENKTFSSAQINREFSHFNRFNRPNANRADLRLRMLNQIIRNRHLRRNRSV